jgi:hypothetical protein
MKFPLEVKHASKGKGFTYEIPTLEKERLVASQETKLQDC